MVRVKGVFVGGSTKIENMYIRKGFWCANCGEVNILEDYTTTRPRLDSEIPNYLASRNLYKQKCRMCFSSGISHEPYEDTVPALRLELHDIEASNNPPSIRVIVFNDYSMDVFYLEQVRVTGSIQRLRVKDTVLPHVFVGLGLDDPATTSNNSVEYDKKECDGTRICYSE